MWLREEKLEIIDGLLNIININNLDISIFGDLPQLSVRDNSALEKFVDKLAEELDRSATHEADNILYSERGRERENNNRSENKDNRSKPNEHQNIRSDGSLRGDQSDENVPGHDGAEGEGEDPGQELLRQDRVTVATDSQGRAFHWARKAEYSKVQEPFQNSQEAGGFDPKISFTIRRRKGSSIWAYYLDPLDEVRGIPNEEFQLRLTTEPILPVFDGLNYEDVIVKKEYQSDNPLESKGRVSAKINLDAYEDLKLDDEKTGIGVDTARYGTDSSTIAVRQGIHLVDMQKYSKSDLMSTTGYIVQAIKEWHPDYVNIELTGGLGAGVYDRLQELNIGDITILCGIETQGQITRHERLKCFNVRTEMFVLLQERFRAGLITLDPVDEDLAEELVNIKFKILSDGKIMISDNDSIRRAIGRSPDKAISLALSFYSPTTVGIY